MTNELAQSKSVNDMQGDWHISGQVYKSRLSMAHGSVVVDCVYPMPNAWQRFWYRALLGWTWSKLE